MASNKLSEKELKRPDRFQKMGFRFLNWMLGSRKPLIATAVIVILAGVAIAGWNVWKNKNVENRRNELASIEKLYNEEGSKVEEKTSALRQELQTLEQLQQLNPLEKKDDPNAKDALAERRRTLEAQITAVKPDHSESLAKFRAYHEKYSQYREGALAGMRAANILLDRGEKAEAEKILKNIAEKATDEVFYQYQSRMSLVGLWLDAARFDDALKAADEMISLTKDDKELKAQAMLVKGNILVSKGDKSAALGVYDQLIQELPESREAKRAQSLKAIL